MESPATTQDRIPLEDLFPIPALVAAYPNILTVTSLRWQLRHRGENGLARCCVQQGKKLLISKTRYEEWLASRAGGA
jgi:hypothetical protein